ncbi:MULTISPECIES: hypothetical protein [unclassified Mesorhizobium]|uniref:hypothetical protein n=1 Tax=unclassified Mesorhizobium TaxID=325217 RepID=UPI001FDF1CBC|nr:MULTISPECIES: hypothetical protein [unclassified Mesorhizobium]
MPRRLDDFAGAACAALALLVESSLEGLMVIARATNDRTPVQAVADEVAALVEQAVLAGQATAEPH